ncbi:hypothetical protein NMY22_g9050 [Coprinellus aureogranulatus]|nr:hypothetical protein NMY22_g9050 [Coprinellus aureogranulatus]
MADNLILAMGVSDIAMALLMTFSPALLYESAWSHWIQSTTGYKIAPFRQEPVFSHGLASVLVALGVGHIVASRSGAAARPTIFAINATAAVLAIGSVLFQKESGIACTMTLAMSIVETVLTGALYYLGAAEGLRVSEKKRK